MVVCEPFEVSTRYTPAALRLHLGHAGQLSPAAPATPRISRSNCTSTTLDPGTLCLSSTGVSSATSVAVIDNGDAVAELVGLFHVVGGDQHGEVARLLQVVQHLPHRDARDRIESGGGLVEKEDARIVHQAARDFEPPPHAAGERLGLRVAPLGQVDGLQHFGDVLLALRARNAVELGVDAQVFFDGEIDRWSAPGE